MTAPTATEAGDRPHTLASRLGFPGSLLQRGYPPGTGKPVAALGTLAILAGAGLIVTTAAIHLHLYLTGYRHVPRLGVLFLAQAITGFVIGPIVALGRHLILVVGGAAFMAASAVGLILSDNVGFVGIHDSLSAPWATPALVVELIGMVLLGTVAALAVAGQLTRR